MKIYDCFMYFDEDVVLDVRLNFLNKFVDKFIIVESQYNHKGEKRLPQFSINKFIKFKDKIKYILIDKIPEGIENIIEGDDKKTIYNITADQRVNQFDGGNKLSKVDMKILPSYILENKSKFIDWIEE